MTTPSTVVGEDLPELEPLLKKRREPTPLPVKQLAVICLARLAEPIA